MNWKSTRLLAHDHRGSIYMMLKNKCPSVNTWEHHMGCGIETSTKKCVSWVPCLNCLAIPARHCTFMSEEKQIELGKLIYKAMLLRQFTFIPAPDVAYYVQDFQELHCHQCSSWGLYYILIVWNVNKMQLAQSHYSICGINQQFSHRSSSTLDTASSLLSR